MSNYHYFSDEDLAKWQLKPELWAMLDMARSKSVTIQLPQGCPFIITSGKRFTDGNSVLKGAVPDSSHLTGDGVDLHVEDGVHYFAMLKGLYAAGFRRFGHYFTADQTDNLIPRHLHVDKDSTKDQDVAWSKKEQN